MSSNRESNDNVIAVGAGAAALAIRHEVGLQRLASEPYAHLTLSGVAGKLGAQYNRSRLTARTREVLAWAHRRARRRVPQ